MKHIALIGLTMLLISGVCRADDPPVNLNDNSMKSFIYQISDVKKQDNQNFVFIRQAGVGNEALIVQNKGTNNVAILNQQGDNNTAELTQVGSDNNIKSTSLGNNNELEVEQVGDGNVYTNVRIGKGSDGSKDLVQQQGNGHKAVLIQFDGYSGVVIQQRGNALSQPVVVKTGRIGSF